ncbi:hypothetical protein H4W29_006037 [Rhizobium viscosum]|uniref:PEP-CTERM sorting domain-containing protein n=1 Tax=Rhizobium viscosum TaxID=1673 RepID=A0ABR9J132_RHIVS|nr:hypothetical protein [Rhizobium viscosum]
MNRDWSTGNGRQETRCAWPSDRCPVAGAHVPEACRYPGKWPVVRSCHKSRSRRAARSSLLPSVRSPGWPSPMAHAECPEAAAALVRSRRQPRLRLEPVPCRRSPRSDNPAGRPMRTRPKTPVSDLNPDQPRHRRRHQQRRSRAGNLLLAMRKGTVRRKDCNGTPSQMEFIGLAILGLVGGRRLRHLAED